LIEKQQNQSVKTKEALLTQILGKGVAKIVQQAGLFKQPTSMGSALQTTPTMRKGLTKKFTISPMKSM
jgi:hypothetical protein